MDFFFNTVIYTIVVAGLALRTALAGVNISSTLTHKLHVRSWRLGIETRMFRGLRPNRLRNTSYKIDSITPASHVSQVSKQQFIRTNTAMTAANGAPGAMSKTLKLENARNWLQFENCG